MAKPKTNKEETKVMEAKQTKKQTKPKKEVVKKEEVKKVVSKKAAAVKAEVPSKKTSDTKKTATKKTVANKAVKASVEKETKPKEAKKVPVKKTVKKVAAKKTSKKVGIDYSTRSLEECIHIMQLLGVNYDYSNYESILFQQEDLDAICEDIMIANALEAKIKESKIKDYDTGIVMATLGKVMDTMLISAPQFKELKKEVSAILKFSKGEDNQINAKHYLDTFNVAEKILVVGQRRNITNCKDAKAIMKIDVEKFFMYFFDLAYDTLKTWQYEDVEYYQQFAFAIVSQFEDLYEANQNRIQMDCADLFILQNDQGRGDYEYNYVLRDNTIKDYIYYRFASIYVNIDLGKAKAIAQDSFQWVDDRYDYYPKLVEIVNL